MGASSNGITGSLFSGNNIIYTGIAHSPTIIGNKVLHTHTSGDGGETLGSDPIILHQLTNRKGIAKIYLDDGDGEFSKDNDPLIGKSSRGPLLISGSGGTNGGVSFQVYYHNSKTGVECVMCYVNDMGYQVSGSARYASARRSAKSSAADDFTSMAKKGVGVITDLETGIQKIVNMNPLSKALKAATGSSKLALAGSDDDASFGSIVSQIIPASEAI